MEKLEAAIEAILFSAGDSVETGRIAKAIGQDKTTTEKIIRNMMLKYNARDRGIKILELDGAFQLCTKQEYYEYLVEIALQPKKAVLTDVMLETLSIIAYKQPVTKQEIEKIRGVKCDQSGSGTGTTGCPGTSYSFWDNGRIFEEFWSTVDRGSANDQSGENGRF